MDIGPIVRALRRNKVRAGLIVAEIALTLAIVTNCVAMSVEARGKMTCASGFDDDNIVNVRSTPFDPAFREDGYLDNSLKEDLAALRALPGVRAASNTYFLPWQGGGSSTELKPLGGAEGLREELAAENTTKSIRFVGRLKTVGAERLQIESLLEGVERTQYCLLHRGAGTAQGPR